MADTLFDHPMQESVLSETKGEPAALAAPLPRASAVTVVASLGVLLVCAVAWGYLWQKAIRLDTNRGEGPLFALLSLMPSWLAWQQWRGTFRRHERAANDAGNWLIGIAAILAICLAALPMMAATPLTLDWLGLFGGWSVWAAVSGYINLAWARQLRRAGWHEDTHGTRAIGWQFSITDMIIWTVLVAGATATFLHFDRQHVRGSLIPRPRPSPFIPERPAGNPSISDTGESESPAP